MMVHASYSSYSRIYYQWLLSIFGLRIRDMIRIIEPRALCSLLLLRTRAHSPCALATCSDMRVFPCAFAAGVCARGSRRGAGGNIGRIDFRPLSPVALFPSVAIAATGVANTCERPAFVLGAPRGITR